MAIKKKAAKTAKKPSRPSGAGASKKKAAPKKPAVKKPAAKIAKAAPKKAAKPAKPVSKKAPEKKPAPKPVAKQAPIKGAKPVAKPTANLKSLPAKPAPKVDPKAAAKPVPAPAPVHRPAPPKLKLGHNFPAKPIKKEPVKPTKVVIPELKTKSAVKYQPDFTKSVLDTPLSHEQTGPTMRYSDSELAEFREIIMKKLDAAKKELNYLQGLITRKDEMGGDESENRYMTMEDGSMSMEREQLSQMASRQITFIDHLEKALMRIENKTYGICRVTGKLIDKARLRAVPHATLSIEAKQMQHK
ncbi:MAG TPA: TraR/DksA C4-type zinc finger protein [Chitinophagaceae bacterium]|nr:TraR/DksA C4-type zinc finger protein [Chitinophagaceae bacterium]